MEIEERAKKYAEGKALEAITEAIERAYAKGFADGFEEGQNNKEPFIEDNVEYVDLGLPSGTKWSKEYIRGENNLFKRFTYDEAAMVNIPTSEQFQELVNCCNWKNIMDGNIVTSVKITGINGNYISLDQEFYSTYIGSNKEVPKFWIKTESNLSNGNFRLSLNLSSQHRVGYSFMGEKFPLMLVK